MTHVSRRDLLIGTAAVAAAASLPALPAIPAAAVPVEIVPAWVVGSDGEFNWQHIIARTQREALRIFAAEHGDDEDECDHDDYVEDCPCCEAIGSYDAMRVPEWDSKENVTSADWLRIGMGSFCSRCSCETFGEENGHPVGDEAVCEECMTLADWDVVDPERAAELRAERADHAA